MQFRAGVWVLGGSTSISGTVIHPCRASKSCFSPRCVAAREFRKCCALRPPPPCFGLLRLGELRGSARVLPALLRPAAALGGPGADKGALHVGQAAYHGNRRAARCWCRYRPMARPVSGIAPWRPTICLTMANRSKVLRARRSIRVTVITSPEASGSSVRRKLVAVDPRAESPCPKALTH